MSRRKQPSAADEVAALLDERRAQAQLVAQREAEIARQLFGGTITRVHKPVHVEGGPCQESAPDDEEFVPARYEARDLVIRPLEVTCELCLTAMVLTEGDTAAAEPTAYARAIVPVHATVFGIEICSEANVRAYHTKLKALREWGSVKSEIEAATTCKACLKVLREFGSK